MLSSIDQGDKLMSKAIFYYTGSGNSLWVARNLAKELGDTELISMADWKKGNPKIDLDTAGLVFPVHMWGVPPPVIKFTDELKALQPKYLFAVGVNAGALANTLVQLKGVLKKAGLALNSGFSIIMPTNYAPWGGPGTKEEQQRRFDAAGAKIKQIAAYIKAKETRPVEKGPLWQRIVFTPIYHLATPNLAKMDRSFRADEKCNKCGICAKVCPAQNITFNDGKPVWNHKCEQCYACLQWCPQEAIQYGKNTIKYPRYHQPDIQLKDVLKNR
jgi:ferredoxin/flavodoxin